MWALRTLAPKLLKPTRVLHYYFDEHDPKFLLPYLALYFVYCQLGFPKPMLEDLTYIYYIKANYEN